MEIYSENHFDEVLYNKNADYKYILVDFYATWCGPCKRIAPKIEKLEKKYSNIKYLKIDVDELPKLSEKYEISMMPTFLFFKVNQPDPVCDSIEGANIELITKWIKHFDAR